MEGLSTAPELAPSPSGPSPLSAGRVSVFKEVGLIGDDMDGHSGSGTRTASPLRTPVGSSGTSSSDEDARLATDGSRVPAKRGPWYRWASSHLSFRKRRARSLASTASPTAFPSVTHLVLLVLFFIVVLPGLHLPVHLGRARYTASGPSGSPVRGSRIQGSWRSPHRRLAARADSPTDTCVRFSHQSAIVNGTLFIYGGQSRTEPDQTEGTWNNNLVVLPLTDDFQIGSPTLRGQPQPSGPPPVANGYLWNSLTSLFLYGGLFSDSPDDPPDPFSLWEYDIPSSTWKEHRDPKTSAGEHSEPAGQSVQRAAEGAGLSVPELGRGWYFGGHLDFYTTPGWSKQVPRIYLKSFAEYTFPGVKNDDVEGLGENGRAGPEGAWRNITKGGIQDEAGFTNRADGILQYIPGFGSQGIIVGLAGGTNQSFTQMNVIDVYDIATSSWFKQATSGESPKTRVNPCAVVVAAADGSSYNVHMYGGQNLIPYGEQIQYNDMWILSIPAFSWIKVDTDGQANPPARAGHSCNVWDGQMVVVGGYVGQDLTCDSPGVYVFDLSELEWKTQFTALQGSNEQGQQLSQQKSTGDDSHIGLSGSYGYRVPEPVRAVIGGDETGGATLTTPVQTATQGPIATGTPALFTVTQSGTVVTQTAEPDPSRRAGSGRDAGPNVAAIAAGAVAGVLAIVAGYFAFCAWVYRRQLALYKNHVAMSHHVAATPFGYDKSAQHTFLPRSSAASSHPSATLRDSLNGASTASSGVEGVVSDPNRHDEGGGSTHSSTDDLLAGQEPTFLGVLLSPRRSLRVINQD